MITIRIPTEQYAFAEVTYKTNEEYVKEYPEFIKSFLAMRVKTEDIKKEWKEKNDVPFN